MVAHIERVSCLRMAGQYLGFEPDELEGSLPQRFTRVVERFPDQVAIRQAGRQITYDQLDWISSQIAYQLLSASGEAKDPVLLLLDQGIHQIEAILGVAKAGKFFTTLNPDDPIERLKSIRADLQARLIIADIPHMHLAQMIASEADALVDLETAVINGAHVPVKLSIHPSDLFGVFYTSGTTGEPKGVPVNHRNALHRVLVHTNLFYPCIEDRYSHLTTTSFTASISDVFTALLNGATVCPLLITKSQGGGLKTWVNNEQITILRMIAPLLRAFIDTLTPGDILTSVRLVIAGGDLFYARDGRALFDHLPKQALLMNRLSAGEVGTVACMLFDRETLADDEILPVGYPARGKEILILDEEKHQLAPGQVGEIAIRSSYIFPGYWKRPDLTNTKIVADPEKEASMLLTGDYGRFNSDGILEMLGRKDFVVKIRGYRVELQAIENALSNMDLVKEAAVIAHGERGFEKRLIAYVVMTKEPPQAIQILRQGLREQLPEYMIPAAFVFMENLPRTANGKIDRKALPTPQEHRPEQIADFMPARNPTEQALSEIWADVLRLDKVGMEDHFLVLGGDSLKAVQVLGRVFRRFQVEISVGEFFRQPTIAHLAALVQETSLASQTLEPVTSGRMADPSVISIRTGPGPYPLSHSQQRMWFNYLLNPSAATYNEPKIHQILGPLDPEILERSIQFLLARHEILRTCYADEQGEPVQVISDRVDFKLPLLDLQGSAKPREAFWLLCKREIRQPFDLRKDLMIRVVLYRMAPQEHMLLLMTHHIASDQMASARMFDELSLAYRQLLEGAPIRLPRLDLQYADFAVWQHNQITAARFEQQFCYWKERLTDFPELSLPFMKPRRMLDSPHGERRIYPVPPEISQQLKDFSRREGKTLFMVLFAAFALLIQRYSGASEFYLGTVVANRNRPELEDMLGFMVNTLALRIAVSGVSTFRDHLDKVGRTILEALDNQEYPFEKLVERLNPPRWADRHPIFQIIFSMDERKGGRLLLANCLVERMDFHTQTSKFDLSLTVVDRGLPQGSAAASQTDPMLLRFEYNTHLFDPRVIDQIAQDYLTLLGQILTDPELPIISST